MNINDVLQDPVFQDLVRRHELAVRRLREDVVRMRHHYLHHLKRPADESAAEQWKAATLQNAACERLEEVRDSAAELLRYAFEVAPHSNDPEHLSSIAAARAAHEKRLTERTGWGTRPILPKGPEEQVRLDDGAPFTIVLKPQD